MPEVVHNIVILDNSLFSGEQESTSSRLEILKKVSISIVQEVERNYVLSKTTIICCNNGSAYLHSYSLSNFGAVSSAIEKVEVDNHKFDLIGALSLASSIQSPGLTKSSRSILLFSCSPIFAQFNDDLNRLSNALVVNGIIAHVVSLCGDVFVLGMFARSTKGTYYVCPPDLSPEEICAEFINRLPKKSAAASLIFMGICAERYSGATTLVEDGSLSDAPHLLQCPRCGFSLVKVPSECVVCKLIVHSGDLKQKRITPEYRIVGVNSKLTDCYSCGRHLDCDHSCQSCGAFFCNSCNGKIERFWGLSTCCLP